MMKIKTAELTGAALDWAVAKCEGNLIEFDSEHGTESGAWEKYSTRWAKGGPIIEREKIGVCHYNETDGWEVPNWAAWRTDIDDRQMIMGETPLIAAMRCYVASKLGDEIDVPEVVA